jgi:hypothetical protein
MTDDLKKLLDKLKPEVHFLKRYAVMLFIIVFLCIYGFLVIRVNSLVQSEPSQAALDEKLKTINRTKIDQSALDDIQNLQDQNVEVKALFEHARNNPFNE